MRKVHLALVIVVVAIATSYWSSDLLGRDSVSETPPMPASSQIPTPSAEPKAIPSQSPTPVVTRTPEVLEWKPLTQEELEEFRRPPDAYFEVPETTGKARLVASVSKGQVLMSLCNDGPGPVIFKVWGRDESVLKKEFVYSDPIGPKNQTFGRKFCAEIESRWFRLEEGQKIVKEYSSSWLSPEWTPGVPLHLEVVIYEGKKEKTLRSNEFQPPKQWAAEIKKEL